LKKFWHDNRFVAHGLTAFLNPTVVDALSIREFWKAVATVGSASWKPIQEVFGNIFGQSKLFPARSYPFQETCVAPPENTEEIFRETSEHENPSTAPVLHAQAHLRVMK
jgi:hypothetical protein